MRFSGGALVLARPHAAATETFSLTAARNFFAPSVFGCSVAQLAVLPCVRSHAPKASARVVAAQEIAGLDAKLANVAAEIPRAFFHPGVEKGMNTRVEIDLPLSTAE